MKTISILQYDHEDHQFYPSFVIHDDFQDADNECSFDEVVIQPSAKWMDDYLAWNRFGRLPDDPAEDLSEEDDPSLFSIPTFQSLDELHLFNAQGNDLTKRLQAELDSTPNCCAIQVAPYRPLYSKMVVGPVTAWWHVKDCNYGFVVPVQRLPVSDHFKSRLQAFRCHKGMEFWKFCDPDTMQQLQDEGCNLHQDLMRELSSKESTKESNVPRTSSIASIGAMLEQSCTLVAATTNAPILDKGRSLPLVQSRCQ